MNKKILFVILFAIIICFEGCKFNNANNGSNVIKEANSTHMTDETEISLPTVEEDISYMTDKQTEGFWKDGNTFLVKIKYAMDGEELPLTSEGYAKIHKIRDYNNGVIYNIIIDSNDGNIRNRSMEYFYLEDEKIYVVHNYDDNSDDVDNDNLQLVFQKENMEEDSGKGLHYSITNSDDVVKFSLYTYNVDTNYFHQMEWGKERSINLYKTGYGADRDVFQVEFIDNVILKY